MITILCVTILPTFKMGQLALKCNTYRHHTHMLIEKLNDNMCFNVVRWQQHDWVWKQHPRKAHSFTSNDGMRFMTRWNYMGFCFYILIKRPNVSGNGLIVLCFTCRTEVKLTLQGGWEFYKAKRKKNIGPTVPCGRHLFSLILLLTV